MQYLTSQNWVKTQRVILLIERRKKIKGPAQYKFDRAREEKMYYTMKKTTSQNPWPRINSNQFELIRINAN